MELDVVAFYWQGNERPTWNDLALGSEYIVKLYNGLKQNLTIPYNFTCFVSNRCPIKSLLPDKINVKTFHSPTWKGCLPKLKAFDRSNGFKDRVIVMDLDLVITGNLNEMFSYTGPFMTRSTFVSPKLSGGDIIFFPADRYEFWDALCARTEEVIGYTGGRERFVYRRHFEEMDFVQDLYPGQLLSYKRNVRRLGGKIPNKCRLVSCHGKPRPHQLNEQWIKECWI